MCNIENVFPFALLNCDPSSVGTGVPENIQDGKFHTDARKTVPLTLSYDLSLTVTQAANLGKWCVNDPHFVVFQSVGRVGAALSNGHEFPVQHFYSYSYINCN